MRKLNHVNDYCWRLKKYILEKKIFITLQTILFSLFFATCTSATGEQENYSPATDLYSLPMDESAILQDEQTGMIFAGDQVLVLTKTPFAGNEVLETIAGEQQIEWVGAIPDIGLYQFRTPAMDIPAQDGLLERILQYPFVEGAIPNYLIACSTQPETCRELGDNHKNIDGVFIINDRGLPREVNPRCTFLNTRYLEILPIMKTVSRWFRFSKVKIAVIDSDFVGLQAQFKQVKKNRLTKLPYSYFSGAEKITNSETPTGHGYMVSGVIAADDNGTSTAGLLTAAIGPENVHLFIGAADTKKKFNILTNKWRIDPDFFHTVELTLRAARDAGADVINLSFEQMCEPLVSKKCKTVYSIWKKLFITYPATLFVTGSGNSGVPLQGDDLFPGAMTNFDNLLKVGGYDYCDPGTRHFSSNYSEQPGVLDVAAPFFVPVLNPQDSGASWIPAEGTSLSAPMAAALAGILKSIQPNLTPRELKEKISLSGRVGPVNLGFAALDFPKPILEVLSQRTGLAPEVIHLISRDGTTDPVSIVLNRICGDCLFIIEGVPPIHVRSEASIVNIQESQDPLFSMSLYSEDDETFSFTMINPNSFVVHESITISTEFSVGLATEGENFVGNGIGGSLYIHSCMITARNPMTQEPWMIEINGDFSGQVIWTSTSMVEEIKNTSMTFTLNAQVYDDRTSPFFLYEYIEQNCTLGYWQ